MDRAAAVQLGDLTRQADRQRQELRDRHRRPDPLLERGARVHGPLVEHAHHGLPKV